MKISSSSLSRRNFLKTATTAAAAATLPPNGRSQSAERPVARPHAPGRKLNVACIGVRGPGYGAIRELVRTENIVALCDVDTSMLAHTLISVRRFD
jgi:hypothetical protein